MRRRVFSRETADHVRTVRLTSEMMKAIDIIKADLGVKTQAPAIQYVIDIGLQTLAESGEIEWPTDFKKKKDQTGSTE